MHSPGSCEVLSQKAHSAPVVLDEARWPLMAMGRHAAVVRFISTVLDSGWGRR